jgi:hypothetical protein
VRVQELVEGELVNDEACGGCCLGFRCLTLYGTSEEAG